MPALATVARPAFLALLPVMKLPIAVACVWRSIQGAVRHEARDRALAARSDHAFCPRCNVPEPCCSWAEVRVPQGLLSCCGAARKLGVH